MARILEIQLENVKSIVSGRARLTDGVNFIYGPNGAGKSSILDAIAFTLYGTDWLRRVKLRLADLVRVHAKTAIFRLKVQGVDGKIYIIQRAITPEKTLESGTYVMTEDGRRVAAKDKEVTQFVEKILNIPLHVFSELLYVRQGELRDILELTKRTEAKLDKILKIEALDKLKNEGLREARRLIEAHIKRIEGKLSYLNEDIARKKNELAHIVRERSELSKKLEELKVRLEELTRKRTELELKAQRVQELKTKQRELEVLLNAKLAELARLNELIRELEVKVRERDKLQEELTKLDKAAQELERLQKLREHLMEKKTSFEVALARLKDVKSTREKLERLLSSTQTELERVQEELENIRKLKTRVIKLEEKLNRVEKIREKAEKIKEKITTAKVLIKRLREEIELLSSSKKECPLCERPLDEKLRQKLVKEREEKLNKIKKKLEKLEELYRKAEKILSRQDELKEEYYRLKERISRESELARRAEELKKQIQELEQELSRLEEAESRFAEIQEEYERITRELTYVEEKMQKLQQLLQQRDKLVRELAEAEEARQNYENIVKQMAKLSDEVNALRVELSKVTAELTVLSSVEQEYEKLVQEEQKLRDELSLISGRLSALEQQEAKLRQEIEAKTKDKAELEKQLSKYIEAHRFVMKLMDVVEKIKPVIRKMFLELLNQELNNMFLEVCHKSAFVGIRVTEDYEIYVKRRDGVELSVDALSVGEKNIVALLFRYALAKIVLGYIPFLILDEPTEHLDDEHRRRIAQWIKDISNDVNMVIITSHVDAFETVADNIIRVELINDKGEATFRNA